jgi:hypothetical protein
VIRRDRPFARGPLFRGSGALALILILGSVACANTRPLPAAAGPASVARSTAPADSATRTTQAVSLPAQTSAEADDAWCTIRPILGGVAGAVIGYLLLKDGEMGGLIGPLAGAVVGSVLFRCWERDMALPPPPPPRR